METILWFALGALVVAWVSIRLWAGLEREVPALRAERHLVLARRLLPITILAGIGVPVLPQMLDALLGNRGPDDQWPSLLLVPMLIALLLIGALASFSHRRRLFGETWGPAAFLREQVGYLLVFSGGPLLLLFVPAIGYRFGWAAALAAAVLSSLWLRHFGTLMASAFGAYPLPDPEQAEACARLLASPALDLGGRRAGIAAFGDPRGGLVNAFAVSTLRECRVFFSRRLLGVLAPAEVAAICGHELAHLEHRGPRWVRIQNGLWLLLGLIGVLPVVLLDQHAGWVGPLWVLLVLLLALWYTRRQRREEAACDERALVLGADPRALAGALVALHRTNLIPRRLPAATDQAMTHPSLARRLQALRRLAPQREGLAAGPPAAPLWVASGDGWLRLHGQTLGYHAERNGAAQWTRDLSQLIELYLTPAAGGARLVLREGSEKPVRLLVAAADLADLQAHLDAVDHLLAPIPKRELGFESWAPLIGMAVIAASIGLAKVTTHLQELLLLIPALAVVIAGHGATLALLSALAVGLAAGWLAELLPLQGQGPVPIADLLVVLALGATGVFGLWRLLASGYRASRWTTAILATACLAVALLVWLDAGLRPWEADLALLFTALGDERMSLILPGMALAGVIAVSGIGRRFGVGLRLAGRLGLLLALTGTQRSDADGPLRPFPEAVVRAEPIAVAERHLPGPAYGIAFEGGRFLAELDEPVDTDRRQRFVIGRPEGPMETIEALDILFHDEGWLVLRNRSGEFVLEQQDAGAEPSWRLALPAPAGWVDAELWLDGDEWQLAVWGADDAFATLSGRVGSPEWTRDEPAAKTADESADPAWEPDAPRIYDSTAGPWQLRVGHVQGPRRPVLLRRYQSLSAVRTTRDAGESGPLRVLPGYFHCLAEVDGRRLCLASDWRGGCQSWSVWGFDHRDGELVLRHRASCAQIAYGDAGDLLLYGLEPAPPLRITPAGATFLALPWPRLDEAVLFYPRLVGLRNEGGAGTLVWIELPP